MKQNLDRFIASRPDMEPHVFPNQEGNLAAIYRLKMLSEMAGVSFMLPEEKEPIERTPEHVVALENSLDSHEHVAERGKNILPEVRGPNILELGIGTGSILRSVGKKIQGLDVLVGVEFSPHFFNHAVNRIPEVPTPELGGPKQVFLVRADITKIELGSRPFDTIILTSILHEIKSYYSTKEVQRLLKEIHFGLKPGGRLILCDGFRRPDAMARLRFSTPGAKERFAAYMKKHPHAPQVQQEGDAVILPTTDAVEFGIKGQFENWQGEMDEEYYPFTQLEYVAMLQENGLTVEKIETFPEEGNFLPGVHVEDVKTGKDEANSHNDLMIVAINKA